MIHVEVASGNTAIMGENDTAWLREQIEKVRGKIEDVHKKIDAEQDPAKLRRLDDKEQDLSKETDQLHAELRELYAAKGNALR